jgi:preprotein translocase subunit SecD
MWGGITVLAVLYLGPSIPEPYNKRVPAFVNRIFTKKIQPGLDLQGGLHLVYSVNIEKAIASKVDRIASDLEERLALKTKGFKIDREGRDEILFTFTPPSDAAKLDDKVLDNYRNAFDEVSRDNGTGQVRLRLDPDQVAEVKEYALRQGIETIRGRVDKFGVAEPTILKRGDDIVIELPGLKPEDFERIKQIIGRTAQLEFKLVDDGSEYMTKVAASVTQGGKITVVPEPWTDKNGTQHNNISLRTPIRKDLEDFANGLTGELEVPKDREFGYEEIQENNPDGTEAVGKTVWRAYLLHRRASVTGEYLAAADLSWDQQTNRPEVAFTMDRQGAVLMERLTGQNVGRKMAIVLDGKINSAPEIQSQIGERGRITLGGFGDPFKVQQEAKDLVAVLRSGALPAPLTKSYETQVGPTLGVDTVSDAKWAMFIGAFAVVLFMLVYYRTAGLIANIAMVLNVVFMLAILAAFEAALTLPGIAGLVLAVGMAVDANIIIYERIREELRAGKSARSAVDAGFSRAFWTVFDAHVTNLMAAVVLYSYGSGPIRGFAVTLVIGILSNIATAVYMSRWMFELMLGRRGVVKQTISI